MSKPPKIISDELGITFNNISDAAMGIFTPTLRLGVTGLSRAGKTVFITSLIHNLLTNSSLPAFSAQAEGRLIAAKLSEHPKQTIPRFAYEQHLKAITDKAPYWPNSTSSISQIRITLKFQSNNWLISRFGLSKLNIDIIDYPGEWLLDLELLNMSFADWSKITLQQSLRPNSKKHSKQFFEVLKKVDLRADATEPDALSLKQAFTQYLSKCKKDESSLSILLPGRFLMPGDLEGSPALSFSPLPAQKNPVKKTSLYAMFERRFEAYKSQIVKPFFIEHFAQLDRQIVLVDVLRSLNLGHQAISDLEIALEQVLTCFNTGSKNPLMQLITRKIDRILFAATKADHLHHTSHNRLEAILKRLVKDATKKAKFTGAQTNSIALSSIRSTFENEIKQDGEKLHTIVGYPQRDEKLDKETYDGKTEIALFPGDLPSDTESIFQDKKHPVKLNFLRFLPPQKFNKNENNEIILPYIRLDKALEFLIGDWLK